MFEDWPDYQKYVALKVTVEGEEPTVILKFPPRADVASQDQLDITDSSTIIMAANSERIAFLIKNVSDTTCYIYLGSPATTSNGVRLKKGASLAGDAYTGIITGITEADTATVAYIEA